MTLKKGKTYDFLPITKKQGQNVPRQVAKVDLKRPKTQKSNLNPNPIAKT